MAGFAVRHPSGQMVHPYQWQANSDYTDGQSTGGYYSVCIDNQFSRFAAKLVNLYITVVKYDDWEKFTKEIEDLNLNMNNFTQVVQTVETNLNLMWVASSYQMFGQLISLKNLLQGSVPRTFASEGVTRLRADKR